MPKYKKRKVTKKAPKKPAKPKGSILGTGTASQAGKVLASNRKAQDKRLKEIMKQMR